MLATRDRGTPEGAPGSPKQEPQNAAPKNFAEGSKLEVKSIQVRREKDRYLTEVEFTFDNQSDQAIATAQAASLLPESKKAAPVFFLAFTGAPPVLPAEQTTNSSLNFSLQGEEIAGELTLRLGSHSALAKSSRSFDPESIAVGETRTFTTLDW